MVVTSVAKAHMVLWQNILLGCLKCSTVWPRAHKYMMQQLKSLTSEFSSLTSPRNDSVYDLCKDLTSVTRWQRISSGWGRVGLCSELSCSESQQERSAQLWKAGKGKSKRALGRMGLPDPPCWQQQQSQRWQGASLGLNSSWMLSRSLRKLILSFPSVGLFQG